MAGPGTPRSWLFADCRLRYLAQMRILHLGKYYAPHKGGMETALRHMAEGLLACGHEVRVLVAGESRRTVRHDLPGA